VREQKATKPVTAQSGSNDAVPKAPAKAKASARKQTKKRR
jgi:hypothetical protein